MPTLLIADDHPLFRAALRGAAAEAAPDVATVEAETLGGVLALLESRDDIDLLLDLHLPGNHGLADWRRSARNTRPWRWCGCRRTKNRAPCAARWTTALPATSPRAPGWTNWARRSAPCRTASSGCRPLGAVTRTHASVILRALEIGDPSRVAPAEGWTSGPRDRPRLHTPVAVRHHPVERARIAIEHQRQEMAVAVP